MYKVMIIDDEKALRGLLKKVIPWEDLGLVVAGEAASGIEAINTIDDIRPDIVFVDIRMPFMDGIEFSRLAMQRYPKMKIIVLTAFDDFSYAKSCIGIGVCEYMLKPIVREDIKKVLIGLVEQLDAEQPQKDIDKMRTEDIKVTMQTIQDYIREHYKDADLNLTAAAERFGFNSSYLSRKFKADTGKSFIDYLTGYRISKACQYADKGVMMYQTAKYVGIPDPNYFGKCFKKYKKVSYSEYAKDFHTQ